MTVYTINTILYLSIVILYNVLTQWKTCILYVLSKKKKKKDYLYKRAKILDDPSDLVSFQNKKNEVKKLLANAKGEFIENK